MKRHKWKIHGVLALLAWFAMGVSLAQAEGIPPVDASGSPHPSPSVTVYLTDASGDDVTDEYLPVPGDWVEISLDPPGNYSISLEPSVAPDPIAAGVVATSALRGTCGNYGSDLTEDFTLSGTTLTAYDHGGIAVVRVVDLDAPPGTDPLFYIIPRDDDWDGIPTYYEFNNCPSGNCDPITDIDTGPDVLSPTWDGIANRDEYRGFRVNGQYVRGDPQVKDVFLHLEETEQCINQASWRRSFGHISDPRRGFCV